MPHGSLATQQANVYTDSLAVNLPSVGANATINHDVALPAGSAVMGKHFVLEARHDAELAHGLAITAAYVVSRDTLRLRLSNFTAGAIDPAAGVLHIAILSVI